MTAMAEIALTTERLSIGTVDPEDLVDLLSVRLSNPERLLRTEGSAGEPGRYDLGMLERDAMIASMDPARCLATVRRIMPLWAKCTMPPVPPLPIAPQAQVVRSRGWPSARKRRSSAIRTRARLE